MAHSRVIQLSTTPFYVDGEDVDCAIITAEDLCDTPFVDYIADYVSDDCDRAEDFAKFVGKLKYGDAGQYVSFEGTGKDSEETWIEFAPGFKEAYFRPRFDQFKYQAALMTFETFMGDGTELYMFRQIITNSFGVRVRVDDGCSGFPESIETFVRGLPIGKTARFYLGGTVDYHY